MNTPIKVVLSELEHFTEVVLQRRGMLVIP